MVEAMAAQNKKQIPNYKNLNRLWGRKVIHCRRVSSKDLSHCIISYFSFFLFLSLVLCTVLLNSRSAGSGYSGDNCLVLVYQLTWVPGISAKWRQTAPRSEESHGLKVPSTSAQYHFCLHDCFNCDNVIKTFT